MTHARKILVVSDVDNTVLGDDRALAEFVEWLTPLRNEILLAYNSGRFVESVRESIAQTGLPDPHAIIGGVGTEIWLAGRPHEERLTDWPTHDATWNAAAIRETLAADARLEFQPQHLQSDYKISYYGHDLTDAELNQIRDRLQNRKLSPAIVYSSSRDLDFLPRGIHKGAAVTRLGQHFGVSPERIIVCGDSGNDSAMFAEGYRGVVVGNAHQTLKDLESPRVYCSPHGYAAGVLDGLKHWRRELDQVGE